VLEVLDNSLPLAKPRLLTDLLIDLTGVDKAVDKAEDQEPVKDQDLAKVAKIAKRLPLTTADINLLTNTNSAAKQI
jgi:hypothetical protein